MSEMSIGSLDKYSDEALMNLYFELSGHPEENAAQLAAVDATIQARLIAAYGATEPGSSPRIRYAAGTDA